MLRARTIPPGAVTPERPEAKAAPTAGCPTLAVRTHLRAGAMVATDTTIRPTAGEASGTA